MVSVDRKCEGLWGGSDLTPTLLVPQLSLGSIHPILSLLNLFFQHMSFPLVCSPGDPWPWFPLSVPLPQSPLSFPPCMNGGGQQASSPSHCPCLSQTEKPDCTERLQLQRRLGCRMFHWFLANIYPELYPSEFRPRFSGKARHDLGKMNRKERGWAASQDRN